MEIEMQRLATIEVLTFDSNQPKVKVSVPVEDGVFQCSNVFDAVFSALGLKKESSQYFTLCEGLVYPKQKIVTADNIPESITELSFQKWVFSSDQEQNVMKFDDVAAHLIYIQAKYFIDTGLLQVSKEVEELLQEYSHPDFVVEKQYTELCQGLPEYYQYSFSKTSLAEELTINSIQFPQGGHVQVDINKTGLHLSQAGKILQFDWTSVQFWQLFPDSKVIKYTASVDNNVYTVSLQTDRFMYMLTITKEMINSLQASDPSSPRFFIDMITKQEDGSTVWQNALFNYKKTGKTQK